MRGPRGDRHLPGTSPEAESFFIEFDYAVVVPTNDQQRRDRNSSERHRPGQIRTTAARNHSTKPDRRNQCGRAPDADAKVANGTVPELRLRRPACGGSISECHMACFLRTLTQEQHGTRGGTPGLIQRKPDSRRAAVRRVFSPTPDSCDPSCICACGHQAASRTRLAGNRASKTSVWYGW